MALKSRSLTCVVPRQKAILDHRLIILVCKIQKFCRKTYFSIGFSKDIPQAFNSVKLMLV